MILTPYYFVGLAAVTCYAALPVIAKKLQIDIPPFTFIAATMLILAVLLPLFLKKNSLYPRLICLPGL